MMGYTPGQLMHLLADELSNFLDYWINLPKFVDERVGEAATRLYEELEVRHIQNPNSFLITSLDHSIVSSVSAGTMWDAMQTTLRYI